MKSLLLKSDYTLIINKIINKNGDGHSKII